MRVSIISTVLAAFSQVVNAAPLPQVGAGLGSLGGLFGGGGGFDLVGLINIIKAFPGPDLRPIAALFNVPEIAKYIETYLDWRNVSAVPFIGPLAYGPAPTGCNKYEILIGRILLCIRCRQSNADMHIARGTGELGPYGFIVGDPLLKKVQENLLDVRGYAVQVRLGLTP
jgi:hypothetical protein